MFAGVDRASEEHAVRVNDSDGRIDEGRRYRHAERGIKALCARLVGLAVELVALERPHGLLVDRLLDAGLRVIAVHPNQVAAMRPRFSAAGGKRDSFDAWVLAPATGCSSPTAMPPRRAGPSRARAAAPISMRSASSGVPGAG